MNSKLFLGLLMIVVAVYGLVLASGKVKLTIDRYRWLVGKKTRFETGFLVILSLFFFVCGLWLIIN